MAAGNLVVNTGTAQAILVDTAGTVDVGVVKIDTSAAGTFGSLWNGAVSVGTLPNLPGGTVTLSNPTGTAVTVDHGTVTLSNPTGTTVTVDHGTITLSNPTGTTVQFNNGTIDLIKAGTITTLPNIPGGTITNLVSGTINAATAVINSATISVLPNLPQGSIQVTAGTITGGTLTNLVSGTINSATAVINSATISVLPNLPQGSINVTAGTMVMSSGTLATGTILSSGTTTGVGTISNVGSIAMLSAGTVTANAGTNLNTSALALETGGNLATLAGIVTASKAATKSADGDFVTIGAKADTAITDSTTTNTHMSFLKGLIKILADVWDSTNHLLGVKIGDGTNTVNVLKSDGSAAGQNAQMIGSAYLSQTWSVTSVSNLTGIDAGGYSWISIHITAQYVGSTPTITWQGSNDNTNWVGFSLVQPLSTLSSGSLSTAASNVIFSGPLNFRYVRLAFTGTYSSGTSTGTILLSTTPRQTVNINGQVAINGTQAVQGQATGSAVPANAFYQGLNTKTTSPTAASTGNLVGATGDIMGEQLVTTGGLVTTAVASGTSANTVIKASGGRLCRILVTTTNTNPMSIFDNATTNSGTIIASLPASPAVGTIYDLQMPAAAGITVGGNAANPGITISWI